MAMTIPTLSAMQTKPDNSKTNTADRPPTRITADQQTTGRSDAELTREIRSAVTSDKDLSTYAHNVKIITLHGKVTLKGPVRTAEEKASIATKASQVAGAGNVVNQITIAPSNGATAASTSTATHKAKAKATTK